MPNNIAVGNPIHYRTDDGLCHPAVLCQPNVNGGGASSILHQDNTNQLGAVEPIIRSNVICDDGQPEVTAGHWHSQMYCPND